MMEAIIDFLNNVFPFHMFYALQLLIAELMFVVGHKKRSRGVLRGIICTVLYILICYFHPMMGNKFVRVLCIFAWSVLYLFVCLDASFKCCLFIAIASYAIQNLGYNVGSFSYAVLNIAKGTAAFYLITGLSFVSVYVLCYFVFVKRFRYEGEILIKNWAIFILSVATIIVVYTKNVITAAGILTATELLSVFTSISCILMLILQFGILRQNDMAEQNKIIERLLQSEKERYESLKETMDLVNMKCHDLRFHVREYRNNELDEKHDKFFEEMEDSISVYDNIARTGNSAIDVLLTEKLRYCNKNCIKVSYIVDEGAVEHIEITDMYSLFGNALDNAIKSVTAEEEEKRIISINVKRKGHFAQITVSNYCSKSPQMENGLPVSSGDERFHGFGMKSMKYIVEKYNGSMVVDMSDNMFNLCILLPLK